MVIRRWTPSSPSACRATSRSTARRQVLARPVQRPDVPLHGQALVLGQRLGGQPGPAAGAERVGARAGRHQVGVEDRPHDVLEPGALADQLLAPADLPPQRLGALVGDPDLRQEAAGVELGQHGRVDAVGLDLGVRDEAHLLGVGDHHPPDVRREHPGHRRGVARRLHDGVVVVGQGGAGEGLEPVAAHVEPPQPGRLAVQQGHRLGEDAVDVRPEDAHGATWSSPLVVRGREPAGDTTTTDPRSRRLIAARSTGGSQGRPGNELELAAHFHRTACPHLRAPGAPCPGWSHHRPPPRGGATRGHQGQHAR
jgi:hypothetical protein